MRDVCSLELTKDYNQVFLKLYSLRKVVIAPNGHTFLLLILNIDLYPILWGSVNLMVITETA